MTANADFPRPPAALLRELVGFGTATLHEAAGRIGALPGGIAPLADWMGLAGAAFPVHAPAGDNLAIHRAMAVARPGDVLVVDHGGGLDFGPFGDVMGTACVAKGIAGLVIHGAIRDSAALIAMGFPVFATGRSIRGTDKRDPGRIAKPIRIGAVDIHPGDAVIGDADGVVILPAAILVDITAKARERETAEAGMRASLAQGALTLDLLGLRDPDRDGPPPSG